MLFSFMTGVLLTAVIFPRFNSCPDAAVIAEDFRTTEDAYTSVY